MDMSTYCTTFGQMLKTKRLKRLKNVMCYDLNYKISNYQISPVLPCSCSDINFREPIKQCSIVEVLVLLSGLLYYCSYILYVLVFINAKQSQMSDTSETVLKKSVRNETRTHTSESSLPPQSSASTNSAIRTYSQSCFLKEM